MEDNQRKSITLQVPTADEIANRRPFAPVSFGIAIVLFFFTFCDIKCTNGQKIASISGMELVTGGELDMSHLGLDGMMTQQETPEKMPPSIWAIIALASAIVGLVFYLMRHKKEALIGAFASGFGLGALWLLRTFTKLAANGTPEMQMIVVVFKPAFWLTVISLAIAGTISFFRLRLWEESSAAQTSPAPDELEDPQFLP